MNVQRSSTDTFEHPDAYAASETRLYGFWLLAARLSLIVITILNLILYIVGTPVYYAQLLPSNHNCVVDCLTQANIQSQGYSYMRTPTHFLKSSHLSNS